MFASTGTTKREIDEYQDKYQDESPSSSGSYESSGSNDSSSQDKNYSFGVPRIPLKEF